GHHRSTRQRTHSPSESGGHDRHKSDRPDSRGDDRQPRFQITKRKRVREVVKKGEQASAASPVRTTAVHVVQASRANRVRTRPAEFEHEPEMLRQIVGGGGTFVVRSRANEGTTYIPGTVEEAKVATAANAFLETVYRCDWKPRPRPNRDMRSAPENHWLMTEAGVAQQEDGKREVCYIPDMRVKAVWIPG